MKGESIRHCVILAYLLVLIAMLPMAPVNAATDDEISAAIDKGVEWLVNQQNTDGSFGSTGEPVAVTAFAALKLAEYAKEKGMDPFDPEYAYSDDLKEALDYIFANAVVDGDNLYFTTAGHQTYTTSIAVMAITATDHPEETVNVGPATGMTYKEVVEKAVKWFASTQNLDGGWRYPWGSISDNSNTGYAVLALTYAQNKFGITIDPTVKTKLSGFIDQIQCDSNGGSGYTSDNPCSWVNVLKTGNLLFEMAFVGDSINTPRAQAALEYIQNTWNENNMDPGWRPSNYQAMYTMMKGFEAMGVDKITVGGTEIDWFDELSSQIVTSQNTVGYWIGDPWDYYGGILSTEWALLTLEKIVEVPEISVYVDIKPGSCPNPINPKDKGVIPVAIVGTEDFDVSTIDVSTIKLGFEETIDDENVSPIRWAYEDVATPFKGELCGCHKLGADGIKDLTLKFDAEELINTLGLASYTGEVKLTIIGNLIEEKGGTKIKGQDCVRIISKK